MKAHHLADRFSDLADARWVRSFRSVLMLGFGGCFLAAAAWVFDPQATLARSEEAGGTALAAQSHRAFGDTLAGLVDRSLDVLAAHARGETPFAELVLWTHDRRNPGQVDPDEVAVISHSRLFKTVTVYRMADDAAAADALKDLERRQPGLTAAGGLDRSLIGAPAFCEAWRALPSVNRLTIGSGISDMEVAADAANGSGGPGLRLTLRWAGESADVADEVSIAIDAAKRPHGAQE